MDRLAGAFSSRRALASAPATISKALLSAQRLEQHNVSDLARGEWAALGVGRVL
jgi:hypothetical protein